MNLLSPPAFGLVPDWQWILATWFGTGLVEPLRAGLAVALAAVIFILLSRFGKYATLAFGLLVVFAGLYVSSRIGTESGIGDDRRIVIDEVGAFLVGASLLGSVRPILLAAYAAVFLALDKLKPWPVEYLERLPGGWGVMADDLAVGLAIAVVFVLFMSVRRLRNA